MITAISALCLTGSAAWLLAGSAGVDKQVKTVGGLHAPVEVIRDRWGVPHIYAQNQNDVFFAQGYMAATDRLFQLDLWRRASSGRLAEVFGPNFVARDRIALLVRYRGDWDEEWRSYSPDTRQIVASFVKGVNAYIRSLGHERPEEFRLAGFDPGFWTPEDVVSRLPGLRMTGNMLQEVNRAQQVARLGLETIKLLSPPDPPAPFVVPHGLDLSDISRAILRDYTAAIGPIRFPGQQGSNNWVVDGTMSKTGKPILANDPHRAMQAPSLRKTIHLIAPGIDMIGAGEPALPGIALGHNQDVAFGFTIVGIDQQDLYVEKENPENPDEYLDHGHWTKFRVEHETIPVSTGNGGGDPRQSVPEDVDLKFTDHGPVIYEDPARHRAYVVRWVGELPGTAGYLAALGLARAHNWQQFQTAAAMYKVPSENLVYADRRGNIGWIASGLAPIRKGWEGLFPVPGDSGEYEWDGYLSSADHPAVFNPAAHYIATANNNILPRGYEHQLAFYWASPERYQRIVEVLGRSQKFSVEDFEQLQQDTVSLVARDFVSLLENWHPAPDTEAADIKREFERWDANIARDSKLALIYEIWRARLSGKLTAKLFPFPRTNPRLVLSKLKTIPQLNDVLSKSLDEAITEIERRLGPDQSKWSWGQIHRVIFRHPLNLAAQRAPFSGGGATFGLDGAAISRERLVESLNIPPVPRPGDANTVNATGGGANFTEAYGASYRQIIDLSNWDHSMMTNVPGESGVPGSRHYSDLVEPWAEGEYHPMPFTRKAVEAAAEERLILKPAH